MGRIRKSAKRSPGVMSLRAYARRRGVSAEAVSKAIMSGRLVASVVRVDGQPKIADADLADREWAAATDLTKAPASVKLRAAERAGGAPDDPPEAGDVRIGMGLAAATEAEKVYKALLAELQLRERRAELVDAEAMTARIADVFTKVRTRILGMPTRAKQQIPHLSAAEVAILDGIVREGLEELSLEVSAEAEVEAEQEAARG